jgi:hypothetical protein
MVRWYDWIHGHECVVAELCILVIYSENIDNVYVDYYSLVPNLSGMLLLLGLHYAEIHCKEDAIWDTSAWMGA